MDEEKWRIIAVFSVNNDMEEIVLVGFGGHAKSIVDSIEQMGKYRVVGYTDFEERSTKYKYLGTDDNLQSIFDSGVKNAVVGIGYLGRGEIRQKIYNTLKCIGFELPVIVDPSAVVSKTATIGEGAFIGKNAIINSEAHIGKMTIINTRSIIEHECIVEDYAHVAIAAVLCGQVEVGEAAFIGANATIIQCMKIASHEIIPAGVTVR